MPCPKPLDHMPGIPPTAALNTSVSAWLPKARSLLVLSNNFSTKKALPKWTERKTICQERLGQRSSAANVAATHGLVGQTSKWTSWRTVLILHVSPPRPRKLKPTGALPKARGIGSFLSRSMEKIQREMNAPSCALEEPANLGNSIAKR